MEQHTEAKISLNPATIASTEPVRGPDYVMPVYLLHYNAVVRELDGFKGNKLYQMKKANTAAYVARLQHQRVEIEQALEAAQVRTAVRLKLITARTKRGNVFAPKLLDAYEKAVGLTMRDLDALGLGQRARWALDEYIDRLVNRRARVQHWHKRLERNENNLAWAKDALAKLTERERALDARVRIAEKRRLRRKLSAPEIQAAREVIAKVRYGRITL